MYLSLLQAENAFSLDLHVEGDTHKGLSKINDLNTLLEPTSVTYEKLARWEVVHEIDPDYPYPKDEIENEDWMGMNEFLHEDGQKAEMMYDNHHNMDSDVFDFIMSKTPSDHPVVEEAMNRMENEH